MEELFVNILVIGNGFDLAHGLPTKYSDFLDFIKCFEIKQKFYNYNSNLMKDKRQINYIDSLFNTRKSDKYSNKVIEELSGLIANNKWIDYFLKIEEDMKKDGKEGWIDFESEISKIVRTSDKIISDNNMSRQKGGNHKSSIVRDDIEQLRRINNDYQLNYSRCISKMPIIK